MSPKDWVRFIAFGLFFVLIVLPLASGAMRLLNSPNTAMSDVISLIEFAAVPWWTGFAQAAPLLFVAVVVMLVWANADEILG